MVPSIPADNWDGLRLPWKGCEPGLGFGLDLLGFLAACRAFVNADCKEVGLRYSLIWEFSAIASSNLERSSLIWEAWALIFPSFFYMFWMGFGRHWLTFRLHLCRGGCHSFNRCLCRCSLSSSKNSWQLIAEFSEWYFRHLFKKGFSDRCTVFVRKLTHVSLLQCRVQILTEVGLSGHDFPCKYLQLVSESLFRFFHFLTMAIKLCY